MESECSEQSKILRNEFGLNCEVGCDYELAKKQLRTLYIKHHPDKGGDTETFKKLQKAGKLVVSDKCWLNETDERKLEEERAFAKIYIDYAEVDDGYLDNHEGHSYARNNYYPRLVQGLTRDKSLSTDQYVYMRYPRNLDYLRIHDQRYYFDYRYAYIHTSRVELGYRNFVLVRKLPLLRSPTRISPSRLRTRLSRNKNKDKSRNKSRHKKSKSRSRSRSKSPVRKSRRKINSCEDKECPETKLCNPRSIRCVLKTGSIGKALTRPQHPEKCAVKICPTNKICNPGTVRCILKSGKLYKTLFTE